MIDLGDWWCEGQMSLDDLLIDTCQVPCDDDCDADCHEGHLPTARREGCRRCSSGHQVDRADPPQTQQRAG